MKKSAPAMVPGALVSVGLGWLRFRKLPAGHAPAPTLDNAGTFAQLGEMNLAFGVIEAMISARRGMVVHMKSEPRLEPLRSDPRFESCADRRRASKRDVFREADHPPICRCVPPRCRCWRLNYIRGAELLSPSVAQKNGPSVGILYGLLRPI